MSWFPEEDVQLASLRSVQTRRIYRLDSRHFATPLGIRPAGFPDPGR